MVKVKNDKIEYTKVEAVKGGMSQLFDENANLIPFTVLKLENSEEIKLFESVEPNSSIRITGTSKGKGFAGVMKRWNFSGGPKTHGQSDKSRAGGSIGTQGQGRVMPGKKMAGRMGNDTISLTTKLVKVDADTSALFVKGGIPGSRNSKVIVYLPKINTNES